LAWYAYGEKEPMLRTIHTSPIGHMMNQDAVQSVVHDLRTPMTVIKGNLQLLLSGVMGDMSAEQLLLIQRSVGPLEDLILMTENLLQAATVEKDDLALKKEATDLDKLITDTIEFYTTPFKQRDMKIFRDGNTYGMKLNLDTFWMKRVLNNLIWNAYKFTPDHGQVIVKVAHTEKGLDLTIEDTGRGIPREKLNSVFQKFSQVSPNKDRKLGTGLGLWICKRVLELHGGSIRAESTEGQGSRFILSIPSSCIL
jgi:signal transduction histidine kinase